MGVPVRYPAPLMPGDRIGVTAISSGVDEDLRRRLHTAIATVRDRGYEVVVGRCMDGARHVSAPATEQARELMEMLLDPTIKAVVPPWGGETAIDLLPLLDWDALRAAEPTWIVGYSDVATIITPLTLLTGIATVHGNNLIDTPYEPPQGLLAWLDILTMHTGTTFTQTPPNRFQSQWWDDYRTTPEVREFTLDAVGRWTRLDSTADVLVEGRLIGGCIETLCNVAGTPYGDMTSSARTAAPQGMLVYVKAGEDTPATTTCRMLHGMRLAGLSPMPTRYSSDGPWRQTRTRSLSMKRRSTASVAWECQSLPMWNAVMSHRSCPSSTGPADGSSTPAPTPN